MPVPLVVIELAPPPTAADPASVLERACTASMSRGRCAIATGDAEPEEPIAVAIVSWQDREQINVRIEVGVRQSGRQRWMVRTITFHAEDDPVERWRAVGLTVGTLVGEAAPEVNAPVDADTPPAVKPASEPAPRKETSTATNPSTHSTDEPLPAFESAHWWAEGGALAAPGIQNGTLRLGGYLTAARTIAGTPFFVTISPSYAVQVQRRDELHAGWLELAAGAGAHIDIPRSSARLRIRLEGFADRLQVSASAPGSAGEEAARWRSGLRGGLDGLWPVGGSWSLVTGASVWSLSSKTDVRLRGQSVGEDGVVGADVRIGACFELD